MNRLGMRATTAALAAGLALAACAGGAGAGGYAPGSSISAPLLPAVATQRISGAQDLAIVFRPAMANLSAVGPHGKLVVAISERGYGGSFTAKTDTCAKVAKFALLGRSGSLTLTGLHVGACAIRVTDTRGHASTLKVTVTNVVFALSAASISQGSRSAVVTLTRVNGKKIEPVRAIVALKACAKGCRIQGPPAPAGRDTFSLAISDAAGGKGNALASGSVTRTVVRAKTNTIPVSLSKYISGISLHGIPSATAGTPFAAAKPLAVTAEDADGNAIVGTFVSAVIVSDADSSGATSLVGSGGTPSQEVRLTGSGQPVGLNYTGLAIAPLTLQISAGGYLQNSATFAPTLSPVTSSAPKSTGAAGQAPSGSYEVDLASGATASFTVAQSGWSAAPYGRSFTFATGDANITGDTNSCASFALTPSENGTTYAVAAASGNAAPGACALTITGGAGQKATVYLTLGTTQVVISGRRKP